MDHSGIPGDIRLAGIARASNGDLLYTCEVEGMDELEMVRHAGFVAPSAVVSLLRYITHENLDRSEHLEALGSAAMMVSEAFLTGLAKHKSHAGVSIAIADEAGKGLT